MKAEDFIKYYSIENSQLSEEYIEAFLEDYKLEEKDLARFKWDLYLENAFKSGRTFGHDIGKLIAGKETGKSLAESLGGARIIILSMDVYGGGELARPVFAVADFKSDKLYYSENDIMRDYTSAEKAIVLSDSDRDELVKGLLETVKTEDSLGFKENETNYNFRLFVITKENEVKRVLGSASEKESFPGFDEFIKKVYKEKLA